MNGANVCVWYWKCIGFFSMSFFFFCFSIICCIFSIIIDIWSSSSTRCWCWPSISTSPVYSWYSHNENNKLNNVMFTMHFKMGYPHALFINPKYNGMNSCCLQYSTIFINFFFFFIYFMLVIVNALSLSHVTIRNASNIMALRFQRKKNWTFFYHQTKCWTINRRSYEATTRYFRWKTYFFYEFLFVVVFFCVWNCVKYIVNYMLRNVCWTM